MSDPSRTERLTGDGLLARAGELHARLVALLASPGGALTLDLSGIGAADISFVQLMVSASLTADRAGRPLTLTGLSPTLRVLFEKAGVDLDPALGRITLN